MLSRDQLMSRLSCEEEDFSPACLNPVNYHPRNSQPELSEAAFGSAVHRTTEFNIKQTNKNPIVNFSLF